MTIIQIDPTKLLNRLGLTMDEEVFKNLEVVRKEGFAPVAVRVKPDFYHKNRMVSKQTINKIRARARELDLQANYTPKGTWLIIKP